jgi:hypothetical protein
MPTPPPLRELQLRLRALIFDHGDGTPAALARLERAAAELPIRGDDRLSAGARLAIYAGMHFVRIRDVLAEDFPATRIAAGDSFDRFVGSYLRAHPTDDPSLRRAGRHLGAFLERHPEHARFPWQADLAKLEWAMIEAFDALDQAVLTAETLQELAPEEWPGLAIEPVRSLRVLDCAFPVERIRTDLLEAGPPAAWEPEPTTLQVWRQGATVYHRRIGRPERRALERLGGGVPFAELCESLAAERSEAEAAGTVLTLLRAWLADELLVALPTS